MRIAFDASPLARPHPFGIVRAVRGALDALERSGELEVVRLVPHDGEELRAWRHGELARRAEARGCVGLHSFVSALPLAARIPRVQTVHELPWRHGETENADLGHRAWVQLGGLVARAVVTATETVARDLAAELVLGAQRVHVVPWGVGSPFTPEHESDVEDELARRLVLAGRPFVLAPGATRPKKRLDATLRALAELGASRATPRVAVVVTGARSETFVRDAELARELGVDVVLAGNVDDRELAALYRLAACTAVLSRSEGFGFPVLEALACGSPVVVAAGGAAAELAGACGIACAADDGAATAQAFASVFANASASTTAEARAARVARAAEFGWERCAASLARLWRGLA
ncbi:MAG: glycosyltransferase [Planctomycetes bacterium]|nr:glycosyltransferase [Planctomycetota bacterium]